MAKKLSNIQKVFGQKTKSNLTTWKKHQKKMQYWNLLFHYYVILPYKVKRMCKIRCRDTVKCPGLTGLQQGQYRWMQKEQLYGKRK